MKKITAREFQKKFGSVNSKMRPGESLEVTRHGKPSGRYTKGGQRPVKMPDFAKELKSCPMPATLGSKLVKEYIGE